MGVFTDQVQGLVSEQKNKRLEKQRKELEKQKKELAKMQLYNILSSYFSEEKKENYKKIYMNLLENEEKWQIIKDISKNEKMQYFLDINYNSILNKVKSSYMIIYNDYIKEEKQQENNFYILEAERILQNTKHLQPKEKKKKINIFIFVFLPFFIVYSFLRRRYISKEKIGLLKPIFFVIFFAFFPLYMYYIEL